jgi:hypothetical protein
MQTNLKRSLAVAAVLTLAGAGFASAQSPSPRQNPNSPQSPSLQSPAKPQDPPSSQAPSDRGREASIAPVSGELTRVNPDAKMFIVKNATGDVQFRYSDQTVITGAQKTVAGLATMSGEQVTVSYRVDGGTNMATKIEVKEKK